MNKFIFNSFYQYLIDSYSALQEKHDADAPAWPEALLEHKQQAFALFKSQGFPSTKQEDWKYTNLAVPLQQIFHFPAQVTNADLKAALASATIKDADAYRIVLLNGKWQRPLSDPLPDGVHFLDGADALHHYYAEEYFASLADPTGISLVALNTAFVPAFNLLHIQKSTDRPLHIVHIYTSQEAAFLPERLLLVVEEGVRTQWIDSFHQLTSAPVFINYVAEQFLKEQVSMDVFLLNQLLPSAVLFHHSETYLHSQSTYHHLNFSFPGAGFIRNNINARLQGSSSEANLWGLYVGGDQQLVDNHTIVDHQVPNCNSNEWYKGILQDKSTGVFNGKIFVEKGAQKTNAFQKNNTILLSREATVHAKPQLEIFADDVKCSHGSTVGQMNEEALFYLRTRGLSELTARQLLIEAFAYDILSKVQHQAVANHVMQLLRRHLHVESSMLTNV
ncbi:MAG: Fe-S cluster assembly protein SufD [Thermoflavifilum sp.]|uniref:Fe-S cluster assembly protein SufD n=1 Tax=Thermoflavifilum sp. TaxID=1968839 RepID=UPI0018A6A7F0|nr:Fe-S cluster assembly protein SufD [Thermoflavifilum sp.]QOR75448.1 MAG: Fe-S cluster assembly protein SufD [Thermoflavifilum sp.]